METEENISAKSVQDSACQTDENLIYNYAWSSGVELIFLKLKAQKKAFFNKNIINILLTITIPVIK